MIPAMIRLGSDVASGEATRGNDCPYGTTLFSKIHSISLYIEVIKWEEMIFAFLQYEIGLLTILSA